MGFEFWGRNCETRSTEPPLEVPFSNFGVGNTEPSAQSGPKPFRSPGFGPQTAKPGPGAPFEASKYENGVKICPNSNVAKKHRFHYKIINKNNNFCVGKGGTLSWAALGTKPRKLPCVNLPPPKTARPPIGLLLLNKGILLRVRESLGFGGGHPGFGPQNTKPDFSFA